MFILVSIYFVESVATHGKLGFYVSWFSDHILKFKFVIIIIIIICWIKLDGVI